MRNQWILGLSLLTLGWGDALGAALRFGDLDTRTQTVEIILSNREPVGGFQIAMEGVELVEDLGGRAEDAEMVIHVGPSMVLAFVLLGEPLPIGDGVLVKLAYAGEPADEICMLEEGTVISDPVGIEIPATIGPCVPVGACDLVVDIMDAPRVVERGATVDLTVAALNECSGDLAFDEAVLEVRGPASLVRSLYDGRPISVGPGREVVAPIELFVPLQAPVGYYDLGVLIYREGEVIDRGSVRVEVE